MNKPVTEIYEALGEASMCWNPRPSGVFDSTKASEIGERLVKVFEEYATQRTPASGSLSKKIPTVQELREAAKDYPDTFLNGALYVVDKYLDAKQPVSGTKLNNICNNCGFVKGTRDYITSGCEHENGFHSIT